MMRMKKFVFVLENELGDRLETVEVLAHTDAHSESEWDLLRNITNGWEIEDLGEITELPFFLRPLFHRIREEIMGGSEPDSGPAS